MRASTNLVQLWRASREDLGDRVVKAEGKKMTRVQKQTGTPLRADHTLRPRKSGFTLDLGLQDLCSQQDKHIGVAFVFIRKPLGECP